MKSKRGGGGGLWPTGLSSGPSGLVKVAMAVRGAVVKEQRCPRHWPAPRGGGGGGGTVFWGVLGAICPLLKPARHGSSAKRRPARKCVPAAVPSVSMATAAARPAHSNGAGPARRHGGRRQPRRLSAGGQRADRERAGEHGRREGRGGWPAAPRGAGSPVPRDIARPGPQQRGAGNAALLRFSVP